VPNVCAYYHNPLHCIDRYAIILDRVRKRAEMLKPKQPEREPRDREDEMNGIEVRGRANIHKVEGDSTINNLIRGSRNTDRMKKEIFEVVSLIVGFLRTHAIECLRDKLEHKTFNVNYEFCVRTAPQGMLEPIPYSWCVRAGFNKNSVATNVDFIVSCSLGEKTLVCVHTGSITVELVNVEEVYNMLDVFVNGIFDRFPRVRELCEPLLKAANKF